MTRNHLLIGISVAAMAAGSASAQTANTNTRQCDPLTSCFVDNNVPDNDRNSSFASETGAGNQITVIQRGDDNQSTAIQNGDNNRIFHRQDGDRNQARSEQTGTGLTSNVRQANRENSATVTQSGTIGTTGNAGTSHVSNIAQGVEVSDMDFGTTTVAGTTALGENNRATVTQSGSTGVHTSVIRQRSDAGNTANGISASDNTAVVRQTALGGSSTITQSSRGNNAEVYMEAGGGADANTRNQSTITQSNNQRINNADGTSLVAGIPTSTNNPVSLNSAKAFITGTQNVSTIDQNGARNTAEANMLGGGGGTSVANAASPSGGTLPVGRSQGNSSQMNQVGRGNFAIISSGGTFGGITGQGNRSAIVQGTTFANQTAPFTGVVNGPVAVNAVTAGNGGGVSHSASVYQRGILDNVSIQQNNNAAAGGNFGTSTQTNSIADVSQRSVNSTTTITQTGSNTAVVSQALNSDNSGGDMTVAIDQIDAGDAPGTPQAGDPIFGGGSGGTPTSARNDAQVSQSGTANSVTVGQNGINARGIVWQQRNSRDNVVNMQQGTTQANTGNFAFTGQNFATGTGSRSVTADVTQSGRGSRAFVRQGGVGLSLVATQAGTATNAGGGAVNSANLLQVAQLNNNNSATVTQSGFNLTATVDQRSNNATNANKSLVTITQSGDNNSATARQLASSGASAADSTSPQSGVPGNAAFPNARSAGTAYSAEIRILQSAGDNVAQVEQRGLGQYAEIRQTGEGNTGGILQEQPATNAVAILHQEGDNNTLFITQSSPGQYIFVRQTGNGNTSDTVVSSSGPNSGVGVVSPAFSGG